MTVYKFLLTAALASSAAALTLNRAPIKAVEVEKALSTLPDAKETHPTAPVAPHDLEHGNPNEADSEENNMEMVAVDTHSNGDDGLSVGQNCKRYII
jgi:hypothetical protein